MLEMRRLRLEVLNGCGHTTETSGARFYPVPKPGVLLLCKSIHICFLRLPFLSFQTVTTDVALASV